MPLGRFKAWIVRPPTFRWGLTVFVSTLLSFAGAGVWVWSNSGDLLAWATVPSNVLVVGAAILFAHTILAVLLGVHVRAVWENEGEPYRSWVRSAAEIVALAWDRLRGLWKSIPASHTSHHLRAFTRVPEGKTPPLPSYRSAFGRVFPRRPWHISVPTGKDPLWISVVFMTFDPISRKHEALTTPCVLEFWLGSFSIDGRGTWHTEYNPAEDRFMRYRFPPDGALSPPVCIDGNAPNADTWKEFAQTDVGALLYLPDPGRATPESRTIRIEAMHLDHVRELKAVLELAIEHGDNKGEVESVVEDTFGTLDRCPTLPPPANSLTAERKPHIMFDLSFVRTTQKLPLGMSHRPEKFGMSMAFHSQSNGEDDRVVEYITVIPINMQMPSWAAPTGTVRFYWR